ncbi:MAG: insulinase family protein [Clostridia bacterium]|nr:insulinase family protein [Clostridia bacterium]
MDFYVGMKYRGFTVDRVREDAKAGGQFIEMTHDSTGARLCYSKNQEENKLFSVAFKTIPSDSTGVFHILEHSVLCGSDKYPVKEPFVELLKSSMNTFLNAMTYPDKTVYPVSSRNEKDFLNLTEVYLDAVFAPCLLTKKNIFLQEGRHLEVNDGAPSFNGVVLNEMRGAMSEADDRLEEAIGDLLFPDSCYRFNSGGEPYDIPKLTYEVYVETYKKFYHPSNSYFYLDGDIPADETFALIESYLEKFDRSPVTWDVETQIPVSAEKVDYFGSDDVENPRDIFATAKIFADFSEIEKIFATGVLCDYLASTNESPLKRAVLASGLAEDLDVSVSDGIKQPYVSIVARNLRDKDSGKIEEIVKSTLRRIVNEGIAPEDLTASLNKYEFSFRQMPEPKGLFRNIITLDSWLYGGDPMLFLNTDGVFEKLRAMISDGGFVKLLKEVFLDGEGEVRLHLKASASFAEEVAENEAKYAEKVYAEMSDAEKEAHKAELEAFNEWQNTPDTEEQVATIPVLPISEVSDVPKTYPTEVGDSNGIKVLRHTVATNGIVYFSVYAPLTQFTLDELSLISVAPSLYGQLPTKYHKLTDLQREIKTYLGDFSVSCQALAEYGLTKNCKPCMIFSASALEENLEKAESLVAEMMTSTLYDETDRIHEIVKQIDEDNRQRIVASGHRFAVSAAKATLSAESAAAEALNGVSMLLTVKGLNSDFDVNCRELIPLIDRVEKESFTKENLLVSVTSDVECSVDLLTSAFEQGSALPVSVGYKTSLPEKTAIKTPSQVSFAVCADNLGKCGVEYNGAFRVAANILSLSYLWNMVRVRGGAYGTDLSVASNGTMFCYSFRDPSPASSLETYGKCAEFIEDYVKSGQNIDKFIISTVASADPLLTPKREGVTADMLWIAGVTDEIRAKNLRDTLNASGKDFMRFAVALRHMAADGTVSVVGGSADTIDGLTKIEI